MRTTIYALLIIIVYCLPAAAEDGHQLWLRKVSPTPVNVVCHKKSATLTLAVQALKDYWQGEASANITLTIKNDKALKLDGFRITKQGIEASSEFGILYGVFELLRRQQTVQPVDKDVFNPAYQRRILNHWDNLNGSIERGYAGPSIFWRQDNPFEITDHDKQTWREYALANASIGINGSVLNNVNASPLILSPEYLARVKAIADILRPYGIKTYLSVKFSSPNLLGGLKTSDPLDPAVINWWKEKAKEVYKIIPDFGGFLVKANSEGQPGPQDFGRTHADGANMLADALKPFGGIVMWRAFVYNPASKDRATQGYTEFVPLDGTFRSNVIIQVKNGPIDFQPREPFSPLFGALKKTVVMPEFQITQEYLGQSSHLVFLAPMWEECLQSETFANGKGSTVARCTDGSIVQQQHTAIAGVANIGADANWCGHYFAQANWYAFGRLAWNHDLKSSQIADEWLKLTFIPSQTEKNALWNLNEWNTNFLAPVKEMMLQSREAAVNYMMPLGLHHLFSAEEHYGPGPWWAPKGVRPDWTPPYYHQADSNGIGFDRTSSGSNAINQYNSRLASQYSDVKTCPEMYLLWFHHLPWTYKVKSGRTLWDELCHNYSGGVLQVRQFQTTWDKSEKYVEAETFKAVQHKLRDQALNAMVWRDACLLYFQQFNHMPIPYEIERPVYNLEELIRNDERRLELKRAVK